MWVKHIFIIHLFLRMIVFSRNGTKKLTHQNGIIRNRFRNSCSTLVTGIELDPVLSDSPTILRSTILRLESLLAKPFPRSRYFSHAMETKQQSSGDRVKERIKYCVNCDDLLCKHRYTLNRSPLHWRHVISNKTRPYV